RRKECPRKHASGKCTLRATAHGSASQRHARCLCFVPCKLCGRVRKFALQQELYKGLGWSPEHTRFKAAVAVLTKRSVSFTRKLVCGRQVCRFTGSDFPSFRAVCPTW